MGRKGFTCFPRDFEIATRFANECNMDALTMHGDQVNRSGALEGGYHDDRQSRLASYVGMTEASAKLEELKTKQADLEEKATEVDQAVAVETLLIFSMHYKK